MSDFLVEHCYEVGYVKAGSNGAPNINASGSLTMDVQPTATGAADTRITNGEQDSMMPLQLWRCSRQLLVQTIVDGWATIRITDHGQDSMMLPLSTSDVELNRALLGALSAECYWRSKHSHHQR